MNGTRHPPIPTTKRTPVRRKRPRLDPLSRNHDLLFLIFQHLKQDRHDPQQTSEGSYDCKAVYGYNSTATSTTLRNITQSRIHDLVQDAFSKICRVNRAWAKVGLPFLWKRPKIRTCRQLDRFAYTMEHHGYQYYDYIQALVVRPGTMPDPNSESLWWGHARCRAILTKVALKMDRIQVLDCNWAGSPFDKDLIRSLDPLTSFASLRALRLEPMGMPSKEEKCLAEEDFNKLISCCPGLESLELEQGYLISNRSVIHLIMTCENLSHFVFPANCIQGWVDALDMGFGENLVSIKIYAAVTASVSSDPSHPSAVVHRASMSSVASASTAATVSAAMAALPQAATYSSYSSSVSFASTTSTAYDLTLDDYSFRPLALRKLQSINLEIGCGEFVKALFSKPLLPKLRSLRILHPSNELLEILSRRLAAQLTMFETKLNEQTDPEIYKVFSRKLSSLQSLDCSPGPVMGLLGRNITTLSANTSLKLLDSVAELCPNLEDLTLWGGSISRNHLRPPSFPASSPSSCFQQQARADPQTGLIYVIEMCPLKRLRLVNAYLGLGRKFWQACGEYGTRLKILDIELLDCKGMNSWGLFEGLQHCKKLQWLRLTELLGVQKQVMLSCLKELKKLCALHLSIPDMETGCFTISMEEIADFVACFCELSEVNLVVPKAWPNSATTTPRSSMDLSERKHCFGLPYARADPTMVFKNALDQNIFGKVEWSVPTIGYY